MTPREQPAGDDDTLPTSSMVAGAAGAGVWDPRRDAQDSELAPTVPPDPAAPAEPTEPPVVPPRDDDPLPMSSMVPGAATAGVWGPRRRPEPKPDADADAD